MAADSARVSILRGSALRAEPLRLTVIDRCTMDFDLKHPWNILGAAGALIFVLSLILASIPWFLIGLGLLSCGIGDMINRPEHMDLGADGSSGNDIARGPDASAPKTVGRLLSGAGLILLVFGLAALFGFLRLPFVL